MKYLIFYDPNIKGFSSKFLYTSWEDTLNTNGRVALGSWDTGTTNLMVKKQNTMFLDFPDKETAQEFASSLGETTTPGSFVKKFRHENPELFI